MREELKALDGTRWTFRGVFVRFGRKPYRDHPPQATVLLRSVEDMSGKVVADHLWLTLTRELAALQLKEGERIQFNARAKVYRKRSRDDYDEDAPRWTLDYKLSYPTKVRRLSATEQIEELPLFKGQELVLRSQEPGASPLRSKSFVGQGSQ